MDDSLLDLLSDNLLKNIMTYVVPIDKKTWQLAKHYISSLKSRFINNSRNRHVTWVKKKKYKPIYKVKSIPQLDYQALWQLHKHTTLLTQTEILLRINAIMKGIQKKNICNLQTYIINLKTGKTLNDRPTSTPLEFWNFMKWWYQFNSVGYSLKINTCEMEVTQAFHTFYNWFKKQSFNLGSMTNHEINQVSQKCHSFLLPIKQNMDIYKTNTCRVTKDTGSNSTYIIRFMEYDIYIELSYVLNNNGKHTLFQLCIYLKNQQGKLFNLFISQDMYNPLPMFQYLNMNSNKKYIDQFILNQGGFQNYSEGVKKGIWMLMTIFYIHFFESVDLNECKRIDEKGLCFFQYIFRN